jgi:hypothetical protein
MLALLHDRRSLDALAQALSRRPADVPPCLQPAKAAHLLKFAHTHSGQQLSPAGAAPLFLGTDLQPRAAVLGAARAPLHPLQRSRPREEEEREALAAADWRGRMAALHAETLALRAVAGRGSLLQPACRAAYQLAAARGARVAPARASVRHVGTAWGARAGRSARGACAPPAPPPHCAGPVEEAIAGRMYCAWWGSVWRGVGHGAARGDAWRAVLLGAPQPCPPRPFRSPHPNPPIFFHALHAGRYLEFCSNRLLLESGRQ